MRQRYSILDQYINITISKCQNLYKMNYLGALKIINLRENGIARTLTKLRKK